MEVSSTTFILIGVIFLGFILIASMIKLSPETAIIVERLGKYRATLPQVSRYLFPSSTRLDTDTH